MLKKNKGLMILTSVIIVLPMVVGSCCGISCLRKWPSIGAQTANPTAGAAGRWRCLVCHCFCWQSTGWAFG